MVVYAAPVAEAAPLDYWLDPQVETFSTGCTTLNLALGGGWAERRMFNIVGDKSTGKTLLAIEAAVQFILKYPHGQVVYCEVEAAFDKGYAECLGMPLDRVRFISDEWLVTAKTKKKASDGLVDEDAPSKKKAGKKAAKPKVWRVLPEDFDEDKHELLSDGIYTVEQLEDALTEVIKGAKVPTLFIVDSYDALSDDAEMARDASDSDGFGVAKAKQGSRMFRKVNQKLAKSNVTFCIVSQVRANIGVTFGRQTTRSGGYALDFYATHVVFLHKVGMLARQVNKIRRVHGVRIRAKVDKNKIAIPHREVEFDIIFGFGVEDVLACIGWLVEHNKWDKVFKVKAEAAALAKVLDTITPTAYSEWAEDLASATSEGWREVEATFLPTRRKYARKDQQQTKRG